MRTLAFPLLASLVTVTACGPHEPPAEDAETVDADTPSAPPPPWLTAYDAGQAALLTPANHPVRRAAARTYPDLSRFGYAPAQKLADLKDVLLLVRDIASVVEESPRYYAFADAPPELGNLVAQYGPKAADEPNGAERVTFGPDGIGTLTVVELGPEVRAAYEKASEHHREGRVTDAIPLLKECVSKSPNAPLIRVALAEAHLAANHVDDARAAFVAAVEVDPTYAPAHRGLAEIALRSGDLAKARGELAEALAYHPSSTLTRAMIARLGGPAPTRSLAPSTPLLEVDDQGAVHVGTRPGLPERMYGACRAVIRYEPEARAAMIPESAGAPYFLSMGEDVLCLEAALGAYAADHLKNPNAPDDAGLESLLAIARDEGVAGYAMIEILGAHRPERARTAPAEVHRAMVGYVEHHLLPAAPKAPETTAPKASEATEKAR